MFYKLPIKPLSLNAAYRGRRFDTPELKRFKKDMRKCLPNIQVPKGKIGIEFIFGVSTSRSDGDNLIKCAQDAIANKYGFNDNVIFEWHIVKDVVRKGKEYISFSIYSLE